MNPEQKQHSKKKTCIKILRSQNTKQLLFY